MGPIVEILEISRSILSHNPGYTISNVIFKFLEDIKGYSLNSLGNSPDTGGILSRVFKDVETMALSTVEDLAQLTVKELRMIENNTLLFENVLSFDLTNEGSNRMNIYGQNFEGVWTPYNDNR